MVAWREIEQNLDDGRSPKDAGILILRGYLVDDGTDEFQCFPSGNMRVFGYWDYIDEAWATTSHPSYGPFFNPTHYALVPPELEL